MNNRFGDGGMPNEMESAHAPQTPAHSPEEIDVPGAQPPEFRVVQPEWDTRESKTVFKDVGAIWRNVSQKTGREFYTLKIGKLRLLVFKNDKMRD